MTVSTSTNSVVYRGNGATTQFAVPFKILYEDHFIVRRRVYATGAIEYTYVGTDYSYSGLGADSGTLTLAGPALDDDYELVIERIVPYTQDLDIVNAGGFYPETVEEQLDLIVMGVQQIAARTARAITVPVGETVSELPNAEERAGGLLAFDAAGNAVVASDSGSESGLRTDLGQVGGSALVAVKAPGVGAVIRTLENVLLERVSVLDFIPTALHASMRVPFGSVGMNTTDLTSYIQAAVNAAGANSEIIFPAATYLIKSTIRVDQHRVHLHFAGPWATIFKFEPTANDIMFHFENEGEIGVLNQCSVLGGCAITSADNTYEKVGFYFADVSSTHIERIHCLSWHTTAGNSEVIRLAGREKITVNNLVGGCDIAVRVMKNAHEYVPAATTIDLDHALLNDIYSTCTSTQDSLTKDSGGGERGMRPHILIDSGVNLTTSSIRDCALVMGTDGIVWWDEDATQTSSNLDCEKVRFEQGTAALGNAIIVRHNYGLNGLNVTHCEWGLNRGVYLTKVIRAWFHANDYPGSTVSINSTAVNSAYTLEINGGEIAPSTLSLTGYYLCEGEGAITSRMGCRYYVHDAGAGTADHPNNATRRGDVFTMTVSQTIASGGSWALNCGTNFSATILANIRVNWVGATKRGIGLAQISALGLLNHSGSHADFDILNTGSKFCLVAANAPSFVNNLGEPVKVQAVIEYVL